ncbi:hypothetical protein [Phenylobacterium sp.]|uniref:hypothetical protein n=1 Tax=Phenylobacterium sp. TaxID=1871053 RepID=UPI003001852A
MLALALGLVPFIQDGGWPRAIALIGISVCAACIVAVNLPAFRQLTGRRRSLVPLIVPCVALAFLAALAAAVSIDLPEQVRVSRASEEEVVERFDIEGLEQTTTRTILRSYHCDIIQVIAHADLAGVRTEQAWTRKHYPGFTFHGQALVDHRRLLRPGNPYSDVISITTADGNAKTLVFDISSSFMAQGDQRDYAQYLRDHRREFCP